MSEVELRQHLQAVIDERDRRYEQRFQQTEQALRLTAETVKDASSKFEEWVNQRFSYVNELRGALTDLSTTMLPRLEYIAEHRALSDRITKVEGGIQKAVWGYLVGIAGILIAAASIWLHK